MKRNVRKLKKNGPETFYREPNRKGRCSTVITNEVKNQAERLLLLDWSQVMIAEKLNIYSSTLSKAINQGRIHSVSSRSKRPKKGKGSRGKSSNIIGNKHFEGKHPRKVYV